MGTLQENEQLRVSTASRPEETTRLKAATSQDADNRLCPSRLKGVDDNKYQVFLAPTLGTCAKRVKHRYLDCSREHNKDQRTEVRSHGPSVIGLRSDGNMLFLPNFGSSD